MHPNESVYFNPLIGGLKGAATRNIPGWGNSLGSTYRQGVGWLNEHAEQNAKLSTIYELRSNIPLIDLRGDIQYENRLKSAIEREGEYIIGVTHYGTHEQSYHRRYLDRFLNPVYEVLIDGIPVLKVWKNDFEHTKEEFRAPDQLIGTVQTFVKGRALFIDFGQPYRLTKLELVFDPNCIIDGSGKIDVSLNQKNWTNVYEELLDIPGFSRFIPNSEPGKLAYLLAADNARYIRIVHNSEDSCLRAGPVTVSARGYGL